jgi:type II secretory pathway pseudopilin PulG
VSSWRRRKGVIGITLLEIMIAMSLMSVVIIAFATVFPSGYRLNFSNLNQSKGANYANAIAEQVSNLSTGVLQNFESAPPGTDVATGLINAGMIVLPDGLSRTQPTQSNAFWLKSVVILNKSPTGPNSWQSDAGATAIVGQVHMSEVIVTVSWRETRRKLPDITRTVTVTTLVNSVMSK